MNTQKYEKARKFLETTGLSLEDALALSDAEIMKLLK